MLSLFNSTSYEATMKKWFWVWGVGPEEDEIDTSNIEESMQPKMVAILENLAKDCVKDFKKDYGIELDYSLESLKLLDQLITPEFRRDLEKRSSPKNFSNPFLVIVAKMGGYFGEVVRRDLGGEWLPMDPYWESQLVINQERGEALFAFHWMIKRFSEELNDGSLYKKYLELKKVLASKDFTNYDLNDKNRLVVPYEGK